MARLEDIVGKNILDRRVEAELSQDDLARKLDVKRLTVYRWEQGKALPTGQNFANLGKVLGVEPWTLCTPVGYDALTIDRANEARLREALATVCRSLGFRLAAKPPRPAGAKRRGGR